jgi:hypothetical protein
VLVLLMVGINESCCWHGLGSHDIHTKFNKDRFKFSKIIIGGYTHTERRSH